MLGSCADSHRGRRPVAGRPRRGGDPVPDDRGGGRRRGRRPDQGPLAGVLHRRAGRGLVRAPRRRASLPRAGRGRDPSPRDHPAGGVDRPRRAERPGDARGPRRAGRAGRREAPQPLLRRVLPLRRNFSIPEAGEYALRARVEAPNLRLHGEESEGPPLSEGVEVEFDGVRSSRSDGRGASSSKGRSAQRRPAPPTDGNRGERSSASNVRPRE